MGVVIERGFRTLPHSAVGSKQASGIPRVCSLRGMETLFLTLLHK